MNPATVKEVIEILKTMPQELPCYFRPKYFGDVEPWESVPVNKNGITKMEEDGEKNITFLC